MQLRLGKTYALFLANAAMIAAVAACGGALTADELIADDGEAQVRAERSGKADSPNVDPGCKPGQSDRPYRCQAGICCEQIVHTPARAAGFKYIRKGSYCSCHGRIPVAPAYTPAPTVTPNPCSRKSTGWTRKKSPSRVDAFCQKCVGARSDQCWKVLSKDGCQSVREIAVCCIDASNGLGAWGYCPGDGASLVAPKPAACAPGFERDQCTIRYRDPNLAERSLILAPGQSVPFTTFSGCIMRTCICRSDGCCSVRSSPCQF